MVICLSLPLLLFTSLSIYHLSTNHLIAVEIVRSFTPNFSPKYLLLAQQYHLSAHKLLIKQYKSFWFALNSLSSSTTIGINQYPFSNTSILYILGNKTVINKKAHNSIASILITLPPIPSIFWLAIRIYYYELFFKKK